jgi:carbon monoxide dehydrogenase subunit G
MELNDEITIPGDRETVLANLTNTEILQRCIPGCEELVKTNNTDYAAKVVLKIGPVKAKFSGTVTLDASEAPDKLRLSGAGDGGLAGFAKGGADVELISEGTDTLLKYTAKAETGGKIAQLGARLIDSTARKLSKAFFAEFEKVMRGDNA